MERLDPFVVEGILANLTFSELPEIARVNKFFRDLVPRVIRRKVREYRALSLENTAKAVLSEKFEARDATSLIRILKEVNVQDVLDSMGEGGGYFYFGPFLMQIIGEHTTSETILSSLKRKINYVELAFALIKKRELQTALRRSIGMYHEGLGQLEYSFKEQKFLAEEYDTPSNGPTPVWFCKLSGDL